MWISRRSPVAAATLSLALAGVSFAQPVGDDDEAPAVEAAPPHAAGKPIPFDRDWLEPFFQHGPAKQAAEKFRGDDWSGAEAGFSKALKSLARGGDERLAASYLLALARANQSNWADAGKLFEELFESYPKLAPTTPTTPPVAGCGAATTPAPSNGPPRWRRGRSPRRRPI